jgi:hypothetical protein
MIKGKDILFICICGLLLLTGNGQAEIRINDILSLNGIGNYILVEAIDSKTKRGK